MAETTSIYIPGQATADGWTMQPEAGTYFVDTEDSTLIQTAIGGPEQRRALWPAGGRKHFRFRTRALTQIEGQVFRDFLTTVRGDLSPFYFFEFDEEYFYREGIGLADGTANLQVPFRMTATPTEVRDDTVGLSSWGFTASYGPGGESRLTSMSALPGNNSVMDAIFYGRKRWIVRLVGAQRTRDFLGGGTTVPMLAQYDLHLVQVI